MNIFYLVRHGEQIPVAGDPELSDRGIRQAQATAKFLKTKDITAIFSSPISRAQMTANIISEELGLPITIDQRLRERINWGDIPGQSFDQFLTVWKKTILDRHYQPVQGDSSHNAAERLIESILHKADGSSEQRIVLVSHGGVISDTVRSILGDQKAQRAGARILRSSGVSHCSITTLTEEQGTIRVISCDEVSHIAR